MTYKKQNSVKKNNNLTILTRFALIFAAAVRLSDIIYYISVTWYPGGGIDLTTRNRVFFGLFAVNSLLFDIITFAVMLALCVWSIKGNAKKSLHVKISIGIILAIFLLDFIPYSIFIVKVLKHSFAHSVWMQFLTEFLYLLLPIIPLTICFILNIKGAKGKEITVKKNKTGLGGFFIIPVIRNVLTPLNLVIIIIAVINSFFRYFIHSGFLFRTADNSSKMLSAVLILSLVLYISALVKMFKRQEKFVPYVIAAECITIFIILHRLIAALLQFRGIYESINYFSGALFQDIWGILLSVLLIVYYLKSDRVRNTFIIKETQPQAILKGLDNEPEGVTIQLETDHIAQNPISETKSIFYVFAVQGPSFGQPASDGIIREKALKLREIYESGSDMKLEIIKPDMWDARLKTTGGSGFTQVSYNIEDFTKQIYKYLSSHRVSEGLIDKGIGLSRQHQLQLSNPMSGLYVIGIPVDAR
jgi:hypothetical protein